MAGPSLVLCAAPLFNRLYPCVGRGAFIDVSGFERVRHERRMIVQDRVTAGKTLHARLLGALGVVVLLLACGPTTSPSTATESPRAPSAPKTLTVAVEEQPDSVVLYGRPGEGGSTSATWERWFIFHGNLTIAADNGDVLPLSLIHI